MTIQASVSAVADESCSKASVPGVLGLPASTAEVSLVWIGPLGPGAPLFDEPQLAVARNASITAARTYCPRMGAFMAGAPLGGVYANVADALMCMIQKPFGTAHSRAF
jgi:hypothetical protein